VRRCARGLALKTTFAEGPSQLDVAAFYICIDWKDLQVKLEDLQVKLNFNVYYPGVRIGSDDGCRQGNRGCAIHGATDQ
jgi:hypothetical protein